MIFRKYRSAKEKFQIYLPPVVGYSFLHLLRLLFSYRSGIVYIPRILVIGLICFIGIPFRTYEYWRYKKLIKKAPIPANPIFIIGHWRSGTTYLHNILCQDPRTGYFTTYQSVFPDNIFPGFGRWLFKTFMKLAMPLSRKGDNVKLGIDYPQEEEFAIGSKHFSSFYFFWYFPRNTMEFYRKYILFDNKNNRAEKHFRNSYTRLIKKSMLARKKNIFISKNPPNSGRIKLLMEMFPGARFIHIYRNPITVILSTRNFFKQMMPLLQLHDISKKDMEENIFNVYDDLMKKLFDELSDIPSDRLVEVRFEDFEKDPLPWIEKIYSKFSIGKYGDVENLFKSYISEKKGYKKNKYAIPEDVIGNIRERCQFALDRWGYDIPEHIDIIEKYDD